MNGDDNLKYLSKLVKTKTENGGLFLHKSHDRHIDFLSHLTKTFQNHAPKELKPYISHVLKSKSADEARKRMIGSHILTGGAFFDWVKKVGNSVADVAKKAGSSIANTASSFYNKAVPLAQKGLEMVKPIIREKSGDAAASVVKQIPWVGPFVEPLVKKGVDYLTNKYIKDAPVRTNYVNSANVYGNNQYEVPY